jgi:hypothetical protein
MNLSKTNFLKFFILLISFSVLFLTACKEYDFNDDLPSKPGSGPNQVFFAVNSLNQLLQFNANAVETPISTMSISGLPSGETILAIDFRPATGELYALGSNSRIYILNQSTGAARAIGTTAFTPALNGSLAGFDFNPTVDRIRIVTSNGQNLRLNPETGAVSNVDGNINGAANASIAGVAYSGNTAGSSTTTLFDIDLNSRKLYKQLPPNDGTLVEIGNLGIGAISGLTGFDISPAGLPLATINVNRQSNLYQIDTTTGRTTFLGNFKISGSIVDIAMPTNPVSYAVDNTNNLLIFNHTATTAPISKTITGLMAGENILGLDFRPANGQLYALGSTSRLYTINASSGAATMLGTAPFATLLSGTNFGFDFNPTVDRIRVVSDNGQNLRLHPETGAIAAVDGSINPGTPTISASAYTNNFAGATTTMLFDIDHTSDKLFLQNPPNIGTNGFKPSLQSKLRCRITASAR